MKKEITQQNINKGRKVQLESSVLQLNEEIRGMRSVSLDEIRDKEQKLQELLKLSKENTMMPSFIMGKLMKH